MEVVVISSSLRHRQDHISVHAAKSARIPADPCTRISFHANRTQFLRYHISPLSLISPSYCTTTTTMSC